MEASLQSLRRSILVAVGLSLAGCEPVVATIDTAVVPGGRAPCAGTTILGPNGRDTGFVRCADGVVLRVQAVTGVTTTINEARCAAEEGSCSTDDECTEKSVGACLDRGIQLPWCTCVYACSQDSDCDAGQICLPPGVWAQGPAWGTCVPASCTTNADCSSSECSFTAWNDGCSDIPRLGCRTPDDFCRTDADCAGTDGWPYCAFDSTGSMTCVGPNCDIGRPFTDDSGAWRRAPVVPRHDWCAEIEVAGAGLDPADRALLRAHWSDVAALEHASIASFSRHTLELLALGAPPGLLAEVQRAAADEVRHAELAFGMVRALGGEPVGPGLLEVADMAPRPTAEAVLEALLVEGCLGETFGAAEAGLAAGRAVGPVRGVLEAIAADEARHAALAWRTVRWLVEARPALRAVLDRVAPPEAASAGDPHRLAAHGLIAEAERAALHRRVWEQVVAPALEALRPAPVGSDAARPTAEARPG